MDPSQSCCCCCCSRCCCSCTSCESLVLAASRRCPHKPVRSCLPLARAHNPMRIDLSRVVQKSVLRTWYKRKDPTIKTKELHRRFCTNRNMFRRSCHPFGCFVDGGDPKHHGLAVTVKHTHTHPSDDITSDRTRRDAQIPNTVCFGVTVQLQSK